MAAITSTDLLEQLNWRYATKSFDPSKTIPSDTWSAIEQSLRLTPSSFGLQPWHFLVITDPAIRQQLLPHSWGQTQVTDCSHFLVLCTRTDLDENFVDQFLQSTADTRGVPLDSLTQYRDIVLQFMSAMDAEQLNHWGSRQTYLAIQRLMDAAALLEVDACPMEGFIPAEYDNILKLADKNLTATVCCALGYRSEEDKYASLAKVRYPVDQLITHI
ncbi:MAG: NAD(P)H-dependent oxidoreductase [Verrucomicrobiota bacterium]